MSNKYVIKNCELTCNGECPNSKTGYCQDCADCKLKQIVELCTNGNNICCSSRASGKFSTIKLAKDILQLLDIQECE